MKLVVHCKREPYDVLVDRTTIWGNPFSHKDGTRALFRVGTVEEALSEYEKWLLSDPVRVFRAKTLLRGMVLGCWCRPLGGFQGRLLCHGQILAGLVADIDPLMIE